jgi:hypothetical protein
MHLPIYSLSSDHLMILLADNRYNGDTRQAYAVFHITCISVLNARCNNPVREGVVSIATEHHVSIPGRGRRCLFSKVSGPALGNDQPPTEHVPRLDDRGMKLTYFPLPSSAKFRDEYSYNFTPRHILVIKPT